MPEIKRELQSPRYQYPMLGSILYEVDNLMEVVRHIREDLAKSRSEIHDLKLRLAPFLALGSIASGGDCGPEPHRSKR